MAEKVANLLAQLQSVKARFAALPPPPTSLKPAASDDLEASASPCHQVGISQTAFPGESAQLQPGLGQPTEVNIVASSSARPDYSSLISAAAKATQVCISLGEQSAALSPQDSRQLSLEAAAAWSIVERLLRQDQGPRRQQHQHQQQHLQLHQQLQLDQYTTGSGGAAADTLPPAGLRCDAPGRAPMPRALMKQHTITDAMPAGSEVVAECGGAPQSEAVAAAAAAGDAATMAPQNFTVTAIVPAATAATTDVAVAFPTPAVAAAATMRDVSTAAGQGTATAAGTPNVCAASPTSPTATAAATPVVSTAAPATRYAAPSAQLTPARVVDAGNLRRTWAPSAAAASSLDPDRTVAARPLATAASALDPNGSATGAALAGSTTTAAGRGSKTPASLQATRPQLAGGSGTRTACRTLGAVTSSGSKCPPSADVGRDEDCITGALRHLAGLADLIPVDRKVPAPVLLEIAGAASHAEALLLQSRASTAFAAAAATWSAPGIRYGLVKLVSYAVRQLLEVPAPNQKLWGLLLRVFATSVEHLTRWHFDAQPAESRACVVELLRLCARTDFVQCISRLFAVLATALRSVTAVEAAEATSALGPASAPAAVAAKITVMDAAAAVGPVTAAAKAEAIVAANFPDMRGAFGGYSSGLAEDLTRLLLLILGPFWAAITRLSFMVEPAGSYPGLQDASRMLRGAMLKSRALEHAVRAAVRPQLAMLLSGSSGPRPSTAATFAICVTLARVLYATRLSQRDVQVCADVLLSGPCVQYFLLLHAVSQLCAVDGGTDYGLPACARLPALERINAKNAGRNEAGPSSAAPSTELGLGSGQEEGRLQLQAKLMSESFEWWSRNRARPCSDRALRAVCERAAAAAMASLPAGALVAAADGGEGGAAGHFSPPEDASLLALAALKCAVTLECKGSAGGGIVGLWAPVVRAANAALRTGLQHDMGDRISAMKLLLVIPLPSERTWLTEAGILLDQPEPGLAAALDAGYVQALERAIRSEMRLTAGTSGTSSLDLIDERMSPLSSRWRELTGLLVYSKPTTAAAFCSTCVKVVVASSKAASADPAKKMRGFLDGTVSGMSGMLLCLFDVLSRYRPGPHDWRWWRSVRRRRCPLGAGVAGIAAEGAAEGPGDGGSGNDPGNAGSGDDDSSGRVTDDSDLAPIHRLSLLFSVTLTCWLQQVVLGLTGIAELAVNPLADGIMYQALMLWLPLLFQAFLASNATAAVGEAPLPAVTVASDGRAADAADGGDDMGREAASSWERLLLGPLDSTRLLEVVAYVMHLRDGEAAQAPCKWHLELAATLLHLVIAFPRQGRQLLKLRLGEGRQTVSLVDWLCGALKRQVPEPLLDPRVRHFLELAPVVANGGEPSAEDLVRLRSEGVCHGRARLAAMLPPPCFIEAALGKVPLCSNPACANMEGDSEAGLELYDGMSYCCGACRRAHSEEKREVEKREVAARDRRRAGG